MTFQESSEYVIPFGMFKGQTIDDCATSDRGLRWLDWARDRIQDNAFRAAIRTYLDHPSIAEELEKILR
jgi:hypothetical protein